MPPAPRSEFELIARYFTRAVPAGRPDVAAGVGDDCALLAPAGGEQLAVSCDMLIEGVHFLPSVDAGALGHKALAVNLSDLAACGAQPRCFFLALGLPRVDERWLDAFASGLFSLADAHGCLLAGGDTTRAPAGVSIAVTVIGGIAPGRALLRSGARVGDDVWVSGTLGDAALGLAIRSGKAVAAEADAARAIERLERPQPRVALGSALAGLASAAIDVSDGLLGDLGHVLERSRVGAEVRWADVPRSDALRARPEREQLQWALAGGDDYELLFTAPADRRDAVAKAGLAGGVAVSRIGSVTSTGRLVVVDGHGDAIDTAAHAFDHFRR
jgi:thiamine-monophosphate kinase